MTIAIAARFPYGRVATLWTGLKDFGVRGLPVGVFLMSDSRFTLAGGARDERGRKVYPLAGDAAAVFAGDVLTAQRAIQDMRTYLRRRNQAARIDPIPVIGRFLREAYAAQRAKARASQRGSVWPSSQRNG